MYQTHGTVKCNNSTSDERTPYNGSVHTQPTLSYWFGWKLWHFVLVLWWWCQWLDGYSSSMGRALDAQPDIFDMELLWFYPAHTKGSEDVASSAAAAGWPGIWSSCWEANMSTWRSIFTTRSTWSLSFVLHCSNQVLIRRKLWSTLAQVALADRIMATSYSFIITGYIIGWGRYQAMTNT